MPFVNIAKARARRIECEENLMRISLGLHQYARDHKGTFPAKLADLYPKYINDERIFDCPSGKPVGTGLNPEYLYITGLKVSSSGKEILARDIDGNHGGKGKNVLRVDGTVEWVS
jgi:hypothetical protein